ncbi:STAS domain-containing protein [Nocardioides humilatus]|uniref:STAS domain-containing protein n=1 Tax=Nocardioides humilatus TaxID=2607660 RepID=A0A5B1LL20_9ACTN|nr:STAS domain-containing protein [Nocardioides humilatus]KAA1420828.1 STAS domain-containing protein [Nocardioides humilatus]
MQIMADGPTLVLSGDFDVRSTSQVRNAVYDHLRSNDEGAITIDLTEVDTVDLTALKVLAVASRFALRDGQRMVLRGSCPAVRRMLHLTHLIRFFEIEREAISA